MRAGSSSSPHRTKRPLAESRAGVVQVGLTRTVGRATAGISSSSGQANGVPQFVVRVGEGGGRHDDGLWIHQVYRAAFARQCSTIRTKHTSVLTLRLILGRTNRVGG